MCSSARRYPEDRQVKRRDPAASLPLAHGVRRTDCKRECANEDARNLSTPPCCLASGQEIHAADRKTRRGETDRPPVSPEFVTRVRVLMKLMPGEAARLCGRREVFSAKVRPDDQAVIRRAQQCFTTTEKFSRTRCRAAVSVVDSWGLTQTPYTLRRRIKPTATIAITVTRAQNFANSSPCRV